MFPVRANGETFRKQQCFRNNVSSFAVALTFSLKPQLSVLLVYQITQVQRPV